MKTKTFPNAPFGVVKIHFKTLTAARAASVDGVPWVGERYRGAGRPKTYIAYVAREHAQETAIEAAQRLWKQK